MAIRKLVNDDMGVISNISNTVFLFSNLNFGYCSDNWLIIDSFNIDLFNIPSCRIIFSERELKFMFAICHRRSVCRLSVVCLSSVCNVGAPYSGD